MLLLHGFMAYKEGDGYLLRKIAEGLKKNGIASARIDFCSMGENRGSRRLYGLETLVHDAKVAYQFLQAEDPLIDANRVGIMGHSLGGRVTLLSTDLEPRCIVLLNGAANIGGGMRMKNVNEAEMKRQGYTIVETSDGRSELLFPKFYEDMDKFASNDAALRYQGPTLVCVGLADPTVPPQVGLDFYEKYQNVNKALLTIEDANHTFNAKTGDYSKVNELIAKMNPWLDANLK
jgi:dipeptidyl aminopeptidase/acylaminoacyl peptidase